MNSFAAGLAGGLFGPTPFRPTRLHPDLDRLLLDRGIRSMPANLVATHKLKILYESRPGWLWFVAPVIVALFSIGYTLSLWRIVGFFENEKMKTLAFVAAVSWLPVAVGIAGGIPFVAMHLSVDAAFLLMVPAAGAVLTVIALIAGDAVSKEATGRWVLVRYLPGVDDKHLRLTPMPSRLQERARIAGSITGVRVYTEYRLKDPFLVAVRGWGPFAEKIYIGGWKTGNSLIDNF